MGDFLLSLAPPGAARSQRRLLRRASGRVSGIRRRAAIGGARLASFHLGLFGVVRPFIAVLPTLGTATRPIELRCTRHSSPFGWDWPMHCPFFPVSPWALAGAQW